MALDKEIDLSRIRLYRQTDSCLGVYISPLPTSTFPFSFFSYLCGVRNFLTLEASDCTVVFIEQVQGFCFVLFLRYTLKDRSFLNYCK